MQNNTLSRADLNYESGTVKNVHYGDVLIKFGDYIDASKIDLPYISDDTKADKFKSSFLQDGDIIIADTAEDDTVGKCTEIQGSEGLRLLSGLHTIACRPKEKYGPMFLGYYINSPAYHNQLKPLMQGIKVTSISKSALQNTDMAIPKSIDEQITIGKCFSYIDNLITLHQRKYDKLVNVKKAMLEKMFPKDGADVPEIRFKGFTEAWEQRKFEDVTYLSGEKNHDNNIFESYSVTNDKGFVPQVEQFENGGTMATADKSMYYIVSKNSFAYNPARINVGSIGYYDKPEKVIVSSLYEVFKTINNINDRFLWHWFKSDAFQKMIEQYQEGGVRLYFYYDKLCICSIDIPEYEEQYMIGEMLDKLDNLITLHQRKFLNLV